MVHERSAGGVLIRRVGPRHEVCLVLRELPRPRVSPHVVRRVWGLPKGHVEAGEKTTAAAIREVREETGYAGAIVRSLGTIAYTFVRPPRHGAPCHRRGGPSGRAGRERGRDVVPRNREAISGIQSRRCFASLGTPHGAWSFRCRGLARGAPPATVSKTVAFFLMRALRRTGPHDAAEIVEARWMPLGRASARLAYENERRILRAAQRHLLTHDDSIA